jgi:hypothetical protein
MPFGMQYSTQVLYDDPSLKIQVHLFFFFSILILICNNAIVVLVTCPRPQGYIISYFYGSRFTNIQELFLTRILNAILNRLRIDS